MVSNAMLLAVLVILAHHDQVYGQDPRSSQLQAATADRDLVRLVDGITSHEGRVEVFANGVWGTVCDDEFDINEAHVICRMLGYPGALEAFGNAYYGKGKGKILMDELECAGDEQDIFDCPMNAAIGVHDCTHGEDAGVECNNLLLSDSASSESLQVRLTCPYNMSCNNKARKRGPDAGECEASMHVEGIVQVYYNNSWWYISADGWDNADVNVVCGQLGYPLSFGTVSNLNRLLPKGTKVPKRIKRRFNTKLKTVLMKDVLCEGTEGKLEQCARHEFGSLRNSRGSKVATARCGFHQHPSCNKICQQQVSICMCVSLGL